MEARQVLGARYRLEERLGEGGMAVVWRAFDLVLGRRVAVKVLSARFAADAHFRESIKAEAQAAARVAHPHLASVYDYGESLNREGEPIPYVVMELLSGRTLTERLATGPLPPKVGLRVCAEIAGGLATAHAANLVHRDVKPGNVMITPTGAKLLDFGVAAIAGAPDNGGPDGKIMGTPNYVAPERLMGGAVVAASDVYGLGLLIFRVLTGRLPWPPGKPTLSSRAEPEPLPDIEGVPPSIGDLFLRCVAMNPENRPSARDAAVILAAAAGIRPVFGDTDADADDGELDDLALSEQTTGESPPPHPALVVDSGGQRAAVLVAAAPDRRYRAVAVVVAALAAVATAVLIFSMDDQTSSPPNFQADPTQSGVVSGTPQLTPPVGAPGPSGSPPGSRPGGPVVVPTVIDGTTTYITLTQPPGGGNGSPGGGGGGGGGGGTSEPPPPVTTQPPPPPDTRREFSEDGNTVVVDCVGPTDPRLLSQDAADGYKLTPPPRDNTQLVKVWFRMHNEVIIFTITCVAWEPQADIAHQQQP